MKKQYRGRVTNLINKRLELYAMCQKLNLRSSAAHEATVLLNMYAELGIEC